MKIQITLEEDGITVENNFYKVFFSSKHGGTIRKFEYLGKDIGLTREGCEYWEPNSPNHYEQEFSPIAIMEALDKDRNFEYLILKVNAKLVSPQLKTEGGECMVHWLFRFNSPMIYTDYQIFPTRPYLKSDRYMCFSPATYSSYAYMKQNEDVAYGEIGTLIDKSWISDVFRGVKWGSVYNNKRGIAIMTPPGERNVSFYRSYSMTEIKLDKVETEDANKNTHVVYLPYIMENTTALTDNHSFREMELKFVLTYLCKEMEKEDVYANWFKNTLREHNRGIWFLKHRDEYLKKGMKVLDLGGGLGGWGAYLNYVDELDLDYVNIDIDPTHIAFSKKLFDKLGIKGQSIICDWSKTHVEEQDVVLCFGAIHQFNEKVFAIANNILKEDGLFIFEIVEKSTDQTDGYDFTLDMPEIKKKLENTGFQVIRMEYCAKYSTFNDIAVISRKK